MIASGELTITAEDFEKILEEVASKEDLENDEEAEKYFEKMWEKM